MVAYVLDEVEGCLYFHLSSLAAHTRALQARAACSLVVGECDDGSLDDPQHLARLSLQGRCSPIALDDGTYSRAKECYLQRLPAALPRFDFADFRLFRFDIGSGRFVGGFGRAYSYSAEALQALLRNRD
jgi:putative heme iron utilization protein